MKLNKVITGGITVVLGIALVSGMASAADWKVKGKKYYIKCSEFTSQDGKIHGNNSYGKIIENGYQDGVTVWYTRPSLQVWDAAVGGTLLATIDGVCMDTADFVGNTRHEATLEQGWADTHAERPADITHRMNGTVVDEAAWNRVTYMAQTADWGLNDPTKASAFQIATWEVISGDGAGGATWNSGNFTAGNVSGALKTAADAYVAQAWQAPQNWSGANSWYFHNSQDFLIRPAVPEIPASLLGPIGLAVVGAIRRKIRK